MSTPTDPKLARLMKKLRGFEGKVRVRVGGLLFGEVEIPNAVLLVEHEGIWSDEPFWTPPGGGVEFGESLQDALVREVREETGLTIEVGGLRYVLEFIRMPLHAVSFYFECRTSDDLRSSRAGSDPELEESQLIRDVRPVPFTELQGLNVYPEGMAEWLPEDARGGFKAGVRDLGTLR